MNINKKKINHFKLETFLEINNKYDLINSLTKKK